MALGAIGGEARLAMVRIGSRFKIRLVAGHAVVRRVGIIAALVAARAVLYIMPFGQREKPVVHLVRRPVGRKGVMAFGAVGGKTRLRVVGVGRSLVILSMAIHALVADGVELQGGSRLVAFLAAHRLVYPGKREAVFDVDGRDVIHQPVIGRVAARAVGAQGLLVHVGMAGKAFRIGLGEHQAGVALAAIDLGVLPRERKMGFVVVETQGVRGHDLARDARAPGFLRVELFPVFGTDFPARRRMAGGAVHGQFRAVRILSKKAMDKAEKANYR